MTTDETGQGMTGGTQEPVPTEGQTAPAAQAPVSAPATGQPAMGTAPPAKSNKKWWFIGCGCLLVLCIFVTAVAAIIGAVWYSQQGGKGPLFDTARQNQVKAVVTDQAEAIKAGDFESAYDLYMSSRYKAETDGPGFAKTVEANVNPLLNNQTIAFRRVGGNETKAQVVADVVDEKGSQVTIEYMLVKESDGSWKIDDFKRTEYKPLP